MQETSDQGFGSIKNFPMRRLDKTPNTISGRGYFGDNFTQWEKQDGISREEKAGPIPTFSSLMQSVTWLM
jgi:hypothetical protein